MVFTTWSPANQSLPDISNRGEKLFFEDGLEFQRWKKGSRKNVSCAPKREVSVVTWFGWLVL